MYRVATFLVDHFWGRPSDMADGLGVLLLTWNQAFYRYGFFSFDHLEECIVQHLSAIEGYRTRSILDLRLEDKPGIAALFEAFLDALMTPKGSVTGRRSPVAVAKALHLLAPEFFPLWDDKIARPYSCNYHREPAAMYWKFCNINRDIAQVLQPSSYSDKKTLLKQIDEYNYAKITKRWV